MFIEIPIIGMQCFDQYFSLTTNQLTILFSLTFQRSEQKQLRVVSWTRHACSDKHLFREEELATALHSKSNHSSQKSQTRLTSDRCSNSMIRRATDFHLPLKKKIAVNYRACTRFIHQRYHLTHTTTVQHLGSLNFSLSNDQIKCIALYKRSLDYGSLFKRTTSL